MSVIIEDNKSNAIPSNSYFVRAYHTAHELRYGYMLTLTKGDEIDELKCEYTIQYKGRHPASEHPIYEVNRSPQVYINGQEPDTMAEELASQIGAVIYPLELETSHEGEILSICNYTEIFERWEKLKKELLEYYEGEVFLKYITLSEQALLANEILFEKIKQDWFLCTYFAPLKGKHENGKAREALLQLPIYENVDFVNYAIQWTLHTQSNSYNEIQVKGLGEVAEERSIVDLEKGLEFPEHVDSETEKPKGSLEFNYHLNAHNHLIESAECQCELMLEVPLKITINLLNLSGVLPQEKSQLGAMVMVDKWGKKKGGFWNKIFNT